MSWIAEKINKIRTDKGLTQEDLAEKSKLSLRTIQRIENGINTPRPKTLVMLCEALEIDSSELIPNKNVRSWAETLADGFFLIALRSEEHTSELQSRQYLVCRLLLEKKKNKKQHKEKTKKKQTN